MTRQEYIHTYSKATIKSVSGTGLFPSVKMAQAILESGDGNSRLAKFFNNHFGIKADASWKGRKAYMQTREVIGGKSVTLEAPFRAYTDAADSFRDHTLFLKKFDRYAEVFNAPTPEMQAEELERAGYATDPNYAELLISLINTHKLKRLDAEMRKKALAA